MAEATDILVVGAGLSGLMAAQMLRPSRHSLLVLDRSARVGGRLSTRQIGPGRADLGAQFFTARTPEFQGWVDRWMQEGLVYKWAVGWSDGSLGVTPGDGHPRYAAHHGMSALAEHLAEDLPIRLETRLVSLCPRGTGWVAQDDRGNRYQARAVLLTPPVPLSLDIVDTCELSLDTADRAALEKIDYEPCLAGLFWVAGAVHLPEPGAVQRPNAAVTWIADNRVKGISPQTTLVTVQAGPEYSRQLWNQPDWQVLVALESALRVFKDYDAQVIEARLERWRHALPIVIHPARYLWASDLPPLVFAGDAFGGPRMEGAALSGLAAGAALRDRVS
jgi:predicted NAD/FAD-dependent oxidoreductase